MRARVAVDIKRRQMVDQLQEERGLLAYLARKQSKFRLVSEGSSESLRKVDTLTKGGKFRNASEVMVYERLWAKGSKGSLGSSTLVRKRCIVTGHGRSARRRFGLSRQRLRLLGRQGAVGGLRRAVW